MGAVITKLLFRPPSVPTYSDVDGSILFITKNLETQTGDLWEEPLIYLQTRLRNRIPAVHLRREDSRFTILFSHANMEDLGIAIRFAADLAVFLDQSILLYDYSGYGLSTGRPSEKNCYADIDAAYDFLVYKCGVDPMSVGCGPSIDLACRKPCGGVIVESGFSSVLRLLQATKATLRGDVFVNIDKILNVMCPVLVIHGMKDELVPIEHAEALSKKSPTAVEPLWVERGTHNNLNTTHRKVVFHRIKQFLTEIDKGQSQLAKYSSSSASR